MLRVLLRLCRTICLVKHKVIDPGMQNCRRTVFLACFARLAREVVIDEFCVAVSAWERFDPRRPCPVCDGKKPSWKTRLDVCKKLHRMRSSLHLRHGLAIRLV